MREEYVSPVGFAKEPSEERRRWIGRIFLIMLLAFVVWLFLYRVLSPNQDSENPTLNPGTSQTVIPGSE